MPGPIVIATVADFIAHRQSLTAWCRACNHRGEIDLTKLPPDLNLYPKKPKRLPVVCGKCGSRDVEFRVGLVDSPGVGGAHGP
ncbi:MAG: hypothetical protein KIS96_03385 [Bauldia sp.]|nr:hypothetical protein [Bauldia sp.]